MRGNAAAADATLTNSDLAVIHDALLCSSYGNRYRQYDGLSKPR